MSHPEKKTKLSKDFATTPLRSLSSPRIKLTHSAPWSFQRRNETLGFALLASIAGAFSLYNLKNLQSSQLGVVWACLFSTSYLSFRLFLFSFYENSWAENFKLLFRLFLGWSSSLFIYAHFFSSQIPLPDISKISWIQSTLAVPIGIWISYLIFRKARPLLQSVRVRAVVVGVTPVGAELYHRSQSSVISDLNIVGFFDFRKETRIQLPLGATFLESPEALAEYVEPNQIDLVIITLPMRQEERIIELMNLLSDTTASVAFVPDIFQFDLMNSSLGELSGIPVITLRDTPFYGWKRIFKRSLDLFLGSCILMLLAPLFLLVGIMIKLTSRGPVFFRQRRLGLGTQPLDIWKFRSMYVQPGEAYPKPAERNDPRITPFGKWLRRYSLDELPQLFNVLKGEMSLVGPRPLPWEHSEKYRGMIQGYSLRHKVKPGMTGWAQINGQRGLIETLDQLQKRVDYDLYYVKHWSLAFDLLILLKSIPKVFVGDENAF